MQSKILLSIVACASFFAAGSALAPAQSYELTDLGMFSPTAINIEGKVAGNYQNVAYLWTRQSGLQSLGTLPGGTTSSAAAINDVGDVVGTADGAGTVVSPYQGLPNQDCTNLTQPFIWTHKNGLQGLGTVGFYNGTYDDWCQIPFYASGLNDLGQEVGYTGSSASYEYGFQVTKSGVYTLVGGNYPPSFVNGVTNTGEQIGQNSTNSEDLGIATTWNSGPGVLGTLGGEGAVDYASAANGANVLGQVVGWSTTGDALQGGSPVHAVLWTPKGVISDLGTLDGDTSSAALKINFSGLVIGMSGTGIYEGWFGPPPFAVTGRPFIWSQRTGMLDLNNLLPPNSGWQLTSVADINFSGQIIGSGTIDGQLHGFLLTPKRSSH